MPNYNEQEMRMLANLLGKPALSNAPLAKPSMTLNNVNEVAQRYQQTGELPPMGIGKTGELNRKAVYDAVVAQNSNRLPIPMNENNMPMFNTDTEYLNYLQEYDPEMFMQMQNQYMTTLGGMSEGKIEPMQYIKGLLGL